MTNLEGRVTRLEHHRRESGTQFFLTVGLQPESTEPRAWADVPEQGRLVRGETESPKAFCQRVIQAARRQRADAGCISVPSSDTAMMQAIRSEDFLPGPMIYLLIDPDGDIDA